MFLYSSLLAFGLLVGAPWWGWRMATTGRYRTGLSERLGRVRPALGQLARGRKVLWVHAVSVGEVFACVRLVRELEAALPGWLIVVSTTTSTGQKVAGERFGSERVFYLPLDFAFAQRAYLRALRPRLVVLVESELWPRMLVECERAGVPVAVVNARISDRSFPRYLQLARWWRPLLARVRVFLAQGQETADRLRALGVLEDRVLTPGNLKYDLLPPPVNHMATRIRAMQHGRGSIVVAGSTLAGEERAVLDAWPVVRDWEAGALLVLAPRHPERFEEVRTALRSSGLRWRNASSLPPLTDDADPPDVLLLDTLGDLAAVYALAKTAFVGGSLVAKGGHNPLEAARFGVPVVMGASYENFREIVTGMLASDAIRVLPAGADAQTLAAALCELVRDDSGGNAMGQRGRAFFEQQSGATERTVHALLQVLAEQEP